MITYILEIIQLTEIEFIYCSFVVFFAGIVRGFSGFALSAIVVASMVGILPTIQLIPMVLFLEAVAGIVMLRGGIRDANMPVVWILSIGSILGIPIGLLATVILPVETSRIIALILILFISLLQLFKLTPGILSSKPTLYATGKWRKRKINARSYCNVLVYRIIHINDLVFNIWNNGRTCGSSGRSIYTHFVSWNFYWI